MCGVSVLLHDYIRIFSEKGVVAIFGPLSKFSSEHIRSITDSMEIPFIETRWNYRSQKVIGGSLVSYSSSQVHPSTISRCPRYLANGYHISLHFSIHILQKQTLDTANLFNSFVQAQLEDMPSTCTLTSPHWALPTWT